MRFKPEVIGGIACVAVLACAAKTDTAQVPRQDLRGVWKLNAVESDPVPTMGSPADGGGHRPPAGVGHSGMGGGRPQPEDIEKIRQLMESLSTLETFELVQSDAAIALSRGGKRGLTITTDGKKRAVTWWDVDDLQTKGEWKSGQLRIERQLSHVKIVEVYSRYPQSNRLIITTTIEGPRKSTYRRVYDRVDG